MRKQILIIEQDANILAFLENALSSAYELIQATGFIHALDILRAKQASRISAVLVDLTMSKDEGSVFLASLTNTPGLRDLPVLVLADSFTDSILFDESAAIKGLQRGTYDYLQKPVNEAALSFRLKNMIERGEYTAYGKYRYLAEYDPVSAIYNRDRFYNATRHMLDVQETKEYVLARFDIDRFKAFNDLFGISAGDRLLAEIGKFMRQTFDNSVTFGRLEADHFAFCIQQAQLQPQAFINQFQEYFSVYQLNFVISARIGIYQIADPSLDVNLMCDRALMALRSVKSGSGARIAYYDESMRKRILEEQALIGDVDNALRNEQFEVYLQPQYNHRTRKIVGAEALVRWNHPQKGLVMPASFIPVLEKVGLISLLDVYVWERTCKLMRRWRDMGLPHISISVNVSRADIHFLNLAETLERITRENEIPSCDLRLEITETAYIENAELLLEAVKELRALGFLLEMDDFGKGQSSLNTLKNVPVDVLKLDMGFLKETESSEGRSGIILNSVMQMAHWLNLAVIAEGVETLRQADYLLSIGCDIVQGYLYARPMPAEKFEAMLQRGDVAEFTDESALNSKIDARELWNPNAEASSIFRHFIGPAGIFELCRNTLWAIRANRKLSDLMELEFSDLKSQTSNVLNWLSPEQVDIALSILNHAKEQGGESTGQLDYVTPVSKRKLHLYLHVSEIGASHYRQVFFIVFENVIPFENDAPC